jgi:hypothetical protein
MNWDRHDWSQYGNAVNSNSEGQPGAFSNIRHTFHEIMTTGPYSGIL